jgi:hypothetical protein
MYGVDRLRTDDVLQVVASGACGPADCVSSSGSSCSGYFTAHGGECTITVTIAGVGECAVPITDPGCDHWIDIVAGPKEGGGISCDASTIEVFHGI